MKKMMNQNHVNNKRGLLFALSLSLTLGFSSCDRFCSQTRESEEPTYSVVFDVIDAKKTDASIENVQIELRSPEGTLKSTASTITPEGKVKIDATSFEPGDYSFTVIKNGYVSTEGAFTWDASKIQNNESVTLREIVYMTELEPYFQISATE